MTKLDADGSAPAIVTDHAFRNMANPWGLCVLKGCGLARAAHEDPGQPPVEDLLATKYRCPDCVHKGEPVCAHGE